MNENPQVHRVYTLLRNSTGYTATEIARRLDMPQPSVRRSIGELRKEGWNISLTNSFYRIDGYDWRR